MISPIADGRAEAALLGGVIAQQRRMADVAPMVRADDFAEERHALIYAALLEIDAAGGKFDAITLAEALKRHGKLGAAGGLAYLCELDTAAPTSAHAVEYARIVAEHAARRRMHEAAADLARKAVAGETSPEELLALAQSRLLDVLPASATGGMESAATVMERALGRLEAAQKSGGGVTGLASGFGDLDRMTTGFHPAELIILAARPGMGKTAFAMNVAENVAIRGGRPVAVFSLEMPSDQLMERVIAAEAEVGLSKLRAGHPSDYELGRVNTASSKIWQAPLHFYEGGAVTTYEIRNAIRRMVAKDTAPALVIIDYLQLMGSAGHFGNREQEVAANSRALKLMAKEFGIPMLVLSQLSRKAEERSGPPKLSDLRESGAIEQDADVVMFLHRDEEGEGEQHADAIDLVVAKQRNGPIGRVGLYLRSEFTKFQSRSRE